MRLAWLVLWLLVAGAAVASAIDEAERDAVRAPAQALERARQALDSEPISDPERSRWLAIASEAAYSLALPDEATGFAAEGLARPGLSAELRQRLAIAHALGLDLAGQPQQSIDELMTVIATLERGHFDRQFLVDALTARAGAYYSVANFRAALADLLRVYPLAPVDGNRTVRADVASALGNVYGAIEDYAHAEQFYVETIDYATRAETWVRASIAEYSLAAVYRRMERWDDAAHYFELSREHSEASGDRQGVAYAEFGLAQVALEQGDLARAERMYRESLPAFVEAHDILPQANIAHGLARVALSRKQYAQAVAEADVGIALIDEVADLDLGYKLLYLRAEAQHAQQLFDDAYQSLQRALTMREKWLEARNNQTLSELRVRFDSERQEQQNALLLKENQLAAARIAEQKQRARLYVVSVIALLLLIGVLVLFAHRSRQQRRRLAEQALTDELTGIANRRRAMAVLAAEFERARRYRTPLAVAALDLDHFKRINDTYGHHVGDRVLQTFAAAIEAALRKTDCFGRLGGEEFVAVLPHTDAALAAVVAERMRGATLAASFAQIDPAQPPSVSIGVAMLEADDPDAESLLKRADAALYQAKQAGRNRVVVASAPTAAGG